MDDKKTLDKWMILTLDKWMIRTFEGFVKSLKQENTKIRGLRMFVQLSIKREKENSFTSYVICLRTKISSQSRKKILSTLKFILIQTRTGSRTQCGFIK